MWTGNCCCCSAACLWSTTPSHNPAWRRRVWPADAPAGRAAGVLLALASTFAGNLLLLGSIANLIVVNLAAKAGIRLDWRQHALTGVPVTLASLLVLWLWMR